MGKGGKGGSGGLHMPKVNIPTQQFANVEGGAQNLAQYQTSMLNTPLALGDWAMNLATGGEVSPAYFGYPGTYGQAAYSPLYPYTTGQDYAPGGGTPAYAPPGTQPTAATTAAGTTPSWAGWTGQGMQPSAGTAQPQAQQGPPPATASQISSASSIPEWQNWFNQNIGKTLYIDGQLVTLNQSNPNDVLQAFQQGRASWQPPLAQQTRGQTLAGGELGALGQMAAQAGQTPMGLDPRTLAGLEQQFFGMGAQPGALPGGTPPALSSIPGFDPSQIAGGNLPMTGPDAGLYPAQSAMIDAQTKAAQAAMRQQEANMGLSASTQGELLSGELAQAGAAQKGQLIQQNIEEAQRAVALGQSAQAVYQNYLQLGQAAQQVAQNWAKLGMGEQTLSMAEQQQQFSQFQQVAAQFATAQSQFWTEGMQGYGLFGQMLQGVLQSYGLESNAAFQQGELSLGQAQIQAGLEEASMAQQASASQSAFGALGSLFGGGGGSGGGLLGGLGGLLGGGTTAGLASAAYAGASAAPAGMAAVGGSAAGGGLLSSIGGLLAGLFAAI